MSKRSKTQEEYDKIKDEIKRLELIVEKRYIAWVINEWEDYRDLKDSNSYMETKEALEKAIKSTGLTSTKGVVSRLKELGISFPSYKKSSKKYDYLLSRLEQEIPRNKYGDLILPRHPEALQALPVEIVDLILTHVPVQYLKSISQVNKFLASVARNHKVH